MTKAKSNRGGQKGNKNAVKHGIYAKFIAVADTENALDEMKNDSNNAELALARTRLADATQRREDAKDDKERLAWDYACRHWTEIIDGMIYRNVNKGETQTMIFNSLLDAIRAANDKQNVAR